MNDNLASKRGSILFMRFPDFELLPAPPGSHVDLGTIAGDEKCVAAFADGSLNFRRRSRHGLVPNANHQMSLQFEFISMKPLHNFAGILFVNFFSNIYVPSMVICICAQEFH